MCRFLPESLGFDSLVSQYNVNTGHMFIKLDAQGAEPLILQGMSKALNSANDVILFTEIMPDILAEADLTIQEYLDLLRQMGFSPVDLGNELKGIEWEKVHALITIIYVTIARQYSQKKEVKRTIYMQKARLFEDLIEANFKSIKFARDYAQMLNTSEKHLNRITKSCFDKTSTQLIGERILLEAKRMLMHSEYNVTQIGEKLGFNESSYFIRFFKKHTGTTPYSDKPLIRSKKKPTTK